MKTIYKLLSLSILLFALSCKKDDAPVSGTSNPVTYSSTYDFVTRNQNPPKSYSIDASSGGRITTPQGTVINIPPNAFVRRNSSSVSGTITIKFLDVYKKKDMILSYMVPVTPDWEPLKSGGEFFIQALVNDTALILKQGKKIQVQLPSALTGGTDTLMTAFRFRQNIGSPGSGWIASNTLATPGINYEMDTVFSNASSYFYEVLQLGEYGQWCNVDRPLPYITNDTTSFTATCLQDPDDFRPSISLVFNDISSAVNLYHYNSVSRYDFAPVGERCTFVAFGVKDGKLYSAFVPFTLQENSSITYQFRETSTELFMAQLQLLN